jgi:hypothetical protein
MTSASFPVKHVLGHMRMSSLLVFRCEKTRYCRDVQSDYLKFLHYSQMGIDYTSIAQDVASV